MTEPNDNTRPAGEKLTDQEMVEAVAGQTDSASENADQAGKDWNGEAATAPQPGAATDPSA
jgi:hypothetical protein